MGLAGSLLIFTGIWHGFEWAMHGRNRDTARLIPVGIVYIALGWCIIAQQFLPTAAWIALVLTTLGMCAAVVIRNTADIPKWVTYTFIVIDIVIVVSLSRALVF